jgi:GTP-binding protein HflX
LEIERRNIKDKEAKIRRAIDEESRLRYIRNDKSQKKASKVPVVALVGYTNVGKSAFMNAVMKKKETESKDLLFQTLTTTSR